MVCTLQAPATAPADHPDDPDPSPRALTPPTANPPAADGVLSWDFAQTVF